MGNFFTDVISKDSRFSSTNRIDDLALLEPVTRQLVLMIIQQAANMGFDMMVFETYRSKARQQELFKQGATQRLEKSTQNKSKSEEATKKSNQKKRK